MVLGIIFLFCHGIVNRVNIKKSGHYLKMGKPRLYYLLVEVDGEYAGHLTTTTAMLGHYLDSENIFFCQIENSQN